MTTYPLVTEAQMKQRQECLIVILYPLCVENMEKQQTQEFSRVRFSAIGVTLPCVSNQKHGGVSVSPFNRPHDDIYQQTDGRAKTEAASNLNFKNCFKVL